MLPSPTGAAATTPAFLTRTKGERLPGGGRIGAKGLNALGAGVGRGEARAGEEGLSESWRGSGGGVEDIAVAEQESKDVEAANESKSEEADRALAVGGGES